MKSFFSASQIKTVFLQEVRAALSKNTLQGTHQTYSSPCKRLIVVMPQAAHMNE